jgi:four helix bundle protein
MANTIEELPIFAKATEFCVAIDAILVRTAFGKYRKLWEQISEANDSITANMCEGFEQPTDDAFARYLYISKGSLREVLTRLRTAHRRRLITTEELRFHLARGDELGKMLGGFINYLARSGFKDRGRHKAKTSRKGPR